MDECYDVVSLALKVLVSGLNVDLDPGLGKMISTSWSSTEDVGDMSPYVLLFNESLIAYIPPVRELLAE